MHLEDTTNPYFIYLFIEDTTNPYFIYICIVFLSTEKKYVDALAQYTAGIDAHPTAVLYANRAYTYLKLEEFGSAIEDAELAIALDPGYVKGYYRRGSAYMVLGKTKVFLAVM